MQIQNVTSIVVQFLREKILIGELKPGQKLNESNLSARLGISRPPIREAFRLLEKDHLVANIPRKGTYVTDISLENFTEVFQTREMVECYAIDLLKASNIKILPKVTAAFNKSLQIPLPINSLNPEELLNYIKVFSEFHVNLVEASGNSLLSNIYHSITFNLARYQFVYFHLYGSTAQDSVNAHRTTLELINNGDYDWAKEELKKHHGHVKELVKNKILPTAVFSTAWVNTYFLGEMITPNQKYSRWSRAW